MSPGKYSGPKSMAKGRFIIPVSSDVKPQHLFCLKTEDRDLWLSGI